MSGGVRLSVRLLRGLAEQNIRLDRAQNLKRFSVALHTPLAALTAQRGTRAASSLHCGLHAAALLARREPAAEEIVRVDHHCTAAPTRTAAARRRI